jgi:hypothetical protein
MENSRGKKGDKTRITIEQLKDMTQSVGDSLKLLQTVVAAMERNSIEAIHPVHYKSGRDGLENYAKLLGAINSAYFFELGIRHDAEAFQQYLAVSEKAAPYDSKPKAKKPNRRKQSE